MKFKVGDKFKIKLTPEDGLRYYSKYNNKLGVIVRIRTDMKYGYVIKVGIDYIVTQKKEISLNSMGNPNSKIRIKIWVASY